MISNHLKYLSHIRDCRNITQAARELNISQPSLSRMLKEKEAELGHPLFNRDTKGHIAGLTEFGELYFRYLDRMIQTDREYHQEKLKFENRNKTVTLGIPILLSSRLIDLIVSLRKLNPETDIEIITDDLESILHKAQDGTLDYAVLQYDVPHKDRTCVHSFTTVLNVPVEVQERHKAFLTVDEHENRHLPFSCLMQETFYVAKTNKLMGKIAEKIFEDLGRPENVVYWDSSELALLASEKEGAVSVCRYSETRKESCVFIDSTYDSYFYLERFNSHCHTLIQP